MRDVLHDDAMAQYFRADQAYAAELLAAVVADGDSAELAILLRHLAMTSKKEEVESQS